MALSKLLLLLGTTVCMFAAAAAKQGFVFTGNIKAPDGTVFRLKYELDGTTYTDSAISQNNSFSLKGKFPHAAMCSLTCSYNKQMRIFVGDNAAVAINGEVEKLFALSIVNSKEQDAYMQYKESRMNAAGNYAAELKRTGEDRHDKNGTVHKAFIALTDSLTVSFVKSHQDMVAATLAIIDNYLTNPDKHGAAKCYRMLTPKVQNSFYGKKILLFIDAGKNIVPGQPAPDFSLKNLDGKQVSLSSLKGSYVFLDFWASWCAPCRKENPFIIKAYHTYSVSNIKFVSVSMDSDNEAWQKAVISDGLLWEQLIDNKSLNGEVADKYGFKSIPFNLLIDPQGKIVAINLRGEALDHLLAATFGKTD